MSKIYLPNGASIHIHNQGWTQTNEANGNLTLKEGTTFLGIITPSGTVHFTESCRHTYYPAKANSLDESFNAVLENIQSIPYYKLAKIKKLLAKFNAKTGSWK